jgi:hypothetical protein
MKDYPQINEVNYSAPHNSWFAREHPGKSFRKPDTSWLFEWASRPKRRFRKWYPNPPVEKRERRGI